MYNQPNNQIRPAQSFGSVQEEFKYNLAKGFSPGDQFTIVEDMPRSKPLRFEIGEGQFKEKDGTTRKFESKSYLIRVISRGYEADMLVYPKLLSKLAVLCPKGLENFKGATFVYDGYNWAYIGIETPSQPISNISQAMRDPRQPDLNPPAPQQDQAETFIKTMVKDMEYLKKVNSPEYQITTKVLMNIAESITPGKALDLITAAKTRGYIIESAGVYRVP